MITRMRMNQVTVLVKLSNLTADNTKERTKSTTGLLDYCALPYKKQILYLLFLSVYNITILHLHAFMSL